MTRRHLLHRMRRDEDGQLLLLILCYTVIAGLLVTVVVNVSKAYLYRRALVAAADAAALTAANQPDLRQIYQSPGTTHDMLPLDRLAAARAVDEYVAAAALPTRFNGFEIVNVSVNTNRVTVTFTANVQMPFVNLISNDYADGYPVHARATARSPVQP